jgi:hypothetical protein
MSKLSRVLLALFLTGSAPVNAAERRDADPICLARKCAKTMLRCGLDGECRSWLKCVLDCQDDKIRCPSVCGFYYQSAQINQTSLCIFKSDCVDLGFGQLPNYEHADGALVTLGDLEGTWWFSASHGGTHIFDFDCQRFDFSGGGPDFVHVAYSVPLTFNGKTRMTGASGIFRQLDSGAIEVIYDNFAGYHEKWYLVDKTEDTILAHVCIGADSICYDYGTILLTRKHLNSLDSRLKEHLNSVARTQFGFGWEQFKQARTNCAN